MLKLRSGILGLTLTSALVLAAASANAADIYRPDAGGGYKDGPAYIPVNTWTGFYIGANGGYGWNANHHSDDLLDPAGGFGGGQIGYNWQGGFGFGPHLVLGIEADIQGADISDSVGGFKSQVNWFGTVRGRIGYAFDRTLIYGTGGFAYGEVENSIPVLGKATETQTGYTVGGGIEYKINPAWSVKGEYQFINLDASSLTGAGPLGLNGTDSSEFHTVRLGVNYHLGGGYEPLK